MAIRNIYKIGDETLRSVSRPVTEFDESLSVLIDDMIDTLIRADGAGLAAPQIGLPERVVVIDVEEGFFEMVNPVILFSKGEQTGPEGCLSVKGKQGTVTRPDKVKAEYRDRYGKKHKLTAVGFFARAVCHELDHLDGVLYTDRANELYDVDIEED